MNKFLPPKPDFWATTDIGPFITISKFNEWYDREIVPLFENALEMTTEVEGILESTMTPHLDGKDKMEAFSFHMYRFLAAHIYFTSERSMIDHAKYYGIVK